MKLSDLQRKIVLNRIEDLFEETKARFLGRFFKGPSLIFEVVKGTDPLHTIEGIYTYAMNMMFGSGIKPNEKHVEQLAEVTGNYLDAQKFKVKNHILADIAGAKNPNAAVAAVKQQFEKSGKYLDLLIGNEAKIVQAYASREGISHLAADIGVSDPTVVFLGVCDQKICKYCKKMYHTEGLIRKPKPYRLSQVNMSYFKPKEWDQKTPFISGHPRCRHSLSMVPPNFGYGADGIIDFLGFNYDYYTEYYKMHKSEELPENLQKTDDSSIFMSYDEYLEWSAGHEADLDCGSGCRH